MAEISIPGYAIIAAAPVISENALFVDSTVVAGSTYDHITRSASGGTYSSYTTIQAAVNSMSNSDDIYVRGGTYYENVLINGDTPNGTIDDYASLQSYPGEWAIIDGQNNEHYTVGKPLNGRDDGNEVSYWRFERLEITGGTDGVDRGAGIYISGGPFIVRYCYIHDNVAASEGENPGGIVGYTWNDSLIEYNWFDNNGMDSGTGGNAAHIAVFSDYLWDETGENGFTESIRPAARNEVRYNYFSGSTIGYKHKGAQLFTGRNVASPETDYVDTYKNYGDKIHHNYFVGQRKQALQIEQDFAQVYNNIIDSVPESIAIDTQPDMQFYKVVVYNNTITNPDKGIIRYGCDDFVFNENPAHYGWDYNNIIDRSDKVNDAWFIGTAINIFNGCSGSRTPLTNPDISNYIQTNNYFYRPDDPDIFVYGSDADIVFYTAAEFKNQTETGSPRTAYTNQYDAGNLLYVGTTSSDKVTTIGSHLIEGVITVADGGIGGAHPYLSGVTIPSYVGASNPSDNSWVNGVMNIITSTAWLSHQTTDTPAWIEK